MPHYGYMAAMWYPGFCEKYGVAAVHIPGHGVPAGLYALQAHFMNASIGDAAWMGFMMGGVGMLCASATSMATNAALRGKDIGMSRGGRMVRRNQAIAFALPVLGMMAFNAAAAPDTETVSQKVPFDLQAGQTIVAAASLKSPQHGQPVIVDISAPAP